MTKKINKEDIDRIYDNDIDVVNRKLYFISEVDPEPAKKLIKGFNILDSNSTTSDNPITLIMSSPGGDISEGFAVYGTIKSCTNTVKVNMLGTVGSMATIIALAADERYIDKFCRFLIHYGEQSEDNSQKNVQRAADEAKKINYLMENLYIDKMIEKDQTMLAEGKAGYIEEALAAIINEQMALDYPPGQKPVKYKFNKDITKKREDIRIVLKVLLNNDTFLSAEETISLGFADALIEYTSF